MKDVVAEVKCIMSWKKLLESVSESLNDHIRLRNDYLRSFDVRAPGYRLMPVVTKRLRFDFGPSDVAKRFWRLQFLHACPVMRANRTCQIEAKWWSCPLSLPGRYAMAPCDTNSDTKL